MLAPITLRHPGDRQNARWDPGTITPPEQLAPVRAAPLPTTGPYPPLFAVLGAHGGAGTSTLARWWAPAADTGLAWPASPRTTQLVVIAARLCLPGLVAAGERLREWHAGATPDGVRVIGLVLTAARPGAVPAVVRRYRSTVAALATEVYEIGWHDELVVTELTELAQFRPTDPAPPRRARLREVVPADVHRAGTQIITRLAATRQGAAVPESEDIS